MSDTRRLKPDDAESLVELYRDYEWWADRTAEDVRDGLVAFYESVGFEPFDTEAQLPSGGSEEFVRMTYPTET